MRIAEVIGAVTLNRCHPSFNGASLKLALPLSLEDLTEGTEADTDGLCVVWDDMGAGIGSRIAISEGAEAAQPFRPAIKPVDNYAAALLDQVSISK